MDAIRVNHVGKAYKQYESRWSRLLEWIVPFSKSRHTLKWILNDINFVAKPGEAIGVLGINGAGKSTLLKLITGISQPTSGSIEINGHVTAILELGMGFHPDFTGRQNVFMAGQLIGLTVAELTSLMPNIIEFAELGDYIDEPVRVYSSGMSIRLAFAVATAKRPDILIVDEALSVGDAYFQHKSFARIRSFQQQGTTLLLVSHDIAAIRGVCDRSIWLDRGVIRAEGSSKEVVDAYSAALYGKQQDVGGSHDAPPKPRKQKPILWKRDVRQDLMNTSSLRNDIQIFDFNEDALGWGDGSAKITSILLTDTNDIPLSWMIGGEEVILMVEALACRDLANVSIGFLVRDRLGQPLFGDNTIITTMDTPRAVKCDQIFTARFHFIMPLLPQGAYTVTAAVAVGTQENHIINDWVNNAVVFQSNNRSGVNGLIGIPMHNIVLEAQESLCEVT
ncbi:MAG: ABC transporter ATP-binding protein [Legionellaceae bacterium]|nr:ABC transporter ATP-binding protein [Legionellaceae bacterium]